jgi:hypothetical protein
VELQIEGLAELDRKLQGLPTKIARGIIRTAVREAQKITLNLVKARTAALPISTRRMGKIRDLMEKGWQLRVPQKQFAGSYAIQVQMDRIPELKETSKRTGKEAYIPAALEYGHDPNVPAHPFARPATEEATPLVEMVLADALGKGIEQAAQEAA